MESTVISLAAAPRALAAGARAAKEMGVAVSLAIVDAGGILGTFARMDGAEIVGEVLAVDKAFTAVSHRTATADLAAPDARHGHGAGALTVRRLDRRGAAELP